jgi:dephospho-CoA kinase
MLRPTHQSKVVPIIGLLGGVASGKSFVGAELERLGCVRVDADRIGHEVLQVSAIQQSLRQLFGPEIFAESGEIDRRKVGALVFGNDSQSRDRRQQLENIVHPAIHQRALEQIESLRASEKPPRAIVIDAPLLIEAGWTKICNYVFFIDTPDEVRRQRSLQRGWTTEQWQAREAAQVSLELKRQAATHFIPGDDTPDKLRRRLDVLLNEMHEID